MSFRSDVEKDVDEVKHDIEEIRGQSFAIEILKDYKRQNKRLFIVWLITFVSFLGLLTYTIYLLNDIEVVETDEYTQEITDFESIDNSTIVNGGK